MLKIILTIDPPEGFDAAKATSLLTATLHNAFDVESVTTELVEEQPAEDVPVQG